MSSTSRREHNIYNIIQKRKKIIYSKLSLREGCINMLELAQVRAIRYVNTWHFLFYFFHFYFSPLTMVKLTKYIIHSTNSLLSKELNVKRENFK